MKVTFKIRDFTHQVKRAKRIPNQLARDAHKVFKKETPIKSGNARRKTRLQGQTIKADYPYANRLDNGYSKQAPYGMTKPTEQYMRSRIDRLIRRIN